MTTTETIDDTTPQDATPPVVVEQAAAETPTDDAPAVARDVETDTLEIPDSGAEGGSVKYVPASALAGARSELKTLKTELAAAKEGSAKATQLEQQISSLMQQVQQMAPFVEAYQAAVRQPQQGQPVAEDDTEARELAQTLDLYTPQGEPDVAKAKKVLGVIGGKAKAEAEAHVAPIHQQTAAQQSAYNMQRALNTPINGYLVDPNTLRSEWARMPLHTTSDEEGAKHLLLHALGVSHALGKAVPVNKAPQAQRGADGKFAAARADAEDIPPPLHSEKAGGLSGPAAYPLSDAEKAYIKKEGISEAEYTKTFRNAPWLR